jgi:hypothetical protein
MTTITAVMMALGMDGQAPAPSKGVTEKAL